MIKACNLKHGHIILIDNCKYYVEKIEIRESGYVYLWVFDVYNHIKTTIKTHSSVKVELLKEFCVGDMPKWENLLGPSEKQWSTLEQQQINMAREALKTQLYSLYDSTPFTTNGLLEAERQMRQLLQVKKPIRYEYIIDRVFFSNDSKRYKGEYTKTTVLLFKDGSKSIVKRKPGEKCDKELAILYAYFQKCSNLSKSKARKFIKEYIDSKPKKTIGLWSPVTVELEKEFLYEYFMEKTQKSKVDAIEFIKGFLLCVASK